MHIPDQLIELIVFWHINQVFAAISSAISSSMTGVIVNDNFRANATSAVNFTARMASNSVNKLLQSRFNFEEQWTVTNLLYRSLHSDLSEACRLNIPNNQLSVMPQQLKTGLGYRMIRLADLTYHSECRVLHATLRILKYAIQFDTSPTHQSDRVRARQDIEKLLIDICKSSVHIQTISAFWTHKQQILFGKKYNRNQPLPRLSNSGPVLIGKFNIFDAIGFIHQAKLNEDTIGGKPVLDIEGVCGGKCSSCGWWFGPSLCTEDKYQIVYVVPMLGRGLIALYFNMSSIDIDQCGTDLPFSGTSKCPMGTTCISKPGNGATLGSYICSCSNFIGSHYTFVGNQLEKNFYENRTASRCPFSCMNPNNTCTISVHKNIRLTIIIVQLTLIVVILLQAILIFKHRDQKVMKSSMWKLLGIVLIGMILIYLSVLVSALPPTPVRCLIYPWLRELGFIVVYGTLTLRLYKLLAEFQSRRARSVQIKDRDIVRYLCIMISTVVFYLLGWTLVNIDHGLDASIKYNILFEGRTRLGQDFLICRPRWWDHLIEIAEFLFLCFGLHLLYCTKTAPSEYHERKSISTAIFFEIFVSTICNLIRYGIWKTTHPDIVLMIYFFRCHLTITSTLLLNLYTKIFFTLCPFKPRRDRFRSNQETCMDSDSAFKIYGSGDVTSVADMDPEDIKTELKRMYIQLHSLKMEQMRHANPHLSTKTVKRKHRRFSMQAFKQHKQATVSEIMARPSITDHRTPPDSSVSVDDNKRIPDDESVHSEKDA